MLIRNNRLVHANNDNCEIDKCSLQNLSNNRLSKAMGTTQLKISLSGSSEIRNICVLETCEARIAQEL